MAYTCTTIFGKRLEARMEPWVEPPGGVHNDDLCRLLDAIGQPYQAVLELAEEEGEDGQATRENLILNPNFTHDTVGGVPAAWQTTLISLEPGSTIKVVTGGQAGNGLEVVTTAAHESEGAVGTCAGTFLQGQAYVATVWVRGKEGGEKVKVILGTTFVPDATESAVITLTTEFQKVEVTWTPKLNRLGTEAGLAVRTSEAKAWTFFVDTALVETGTTAHTYFDGDSEARWQGVAGNAASRRGYVPAYGALLDPVICPFKDLPYLAQFVGEELPKTVPEAEARERVKMPAGRERGTLQSIEHAIKRILKTGKFTIQERTAKSGAEAAYHFNVLVEIGKVTKALEEAIEEVTPAGVFFSVLELKNPWLVGAKKWSEVPAGKTWTTIKEGEY